CSAPPFHGCGTRLTPHPCPLGWHCHQICSTYLTPLSTARENSELNALISLRRISLRKQYNASFPLRLCWRHGGWMKSLPRAGSSKGGAGVSMFVHPSSNVAAGPSRFALWAARLSMRALEGAAPLPIVSGQGSLILKRGSRGLEPRRARRAYLDRNSAVKPRGALSISAFTCPAADHRR
ncbi:hypothetical protein ABID08_004849, partial [Rhizobium binae]